VRRLNELGHETLELTPEEAEKLIVSAQGRYFVVDEATRTLVKEVSLEPGQRIALIPIARGG
jgi:hypothetical protein